MKKIKDFSLISLIILALMFYGLFNSHLSWQQKSIHIAIVLISGTGAYFIIRRHRAARELFSVSQAIAKNAFENTALGMCVAALDLKYIAINKAYCNIIGYSKEELEDITHKDFVHPEDRLIDEPYIKLLMEGKATSFDTKKRYIHKQGHIVWGQATVSLVRDEKGNPKWFVTQIQDISALVETQEKLNNLARSDYLTGSLNRRAFMEKLNEEISRSKREKTAISLILMDIDFFKKVNDTYGHLTGDYVLQQFSACLQENCRSYDFIGRFGGEEFIIGLPNTDHDATVEIAERLRRRIESLSLGINNHLINITSSLGVATLPYEQIEDVDSFITRADNALYQAKRNRNIVCSA